MKKNLIKPNPIIAILYKIIVKTIRSLRDWSPKFGVKQLKRRGLTGANKKRIIKIEDSTLFVWLRKKFHIIRKATLGSSLNLFLNHLHPSVGKRSLIMKKFIVSALSSSRMRANQQIRSFGHARLITVSAILAFGSLLAACGGGGGGGVVVTPIPTPNPVPVINAPVLSIASMSPLPVASPIVITSDKALEGVTQVLVTTPQSTTLPGNAALSADKKSVIITMASPLPYATVITVTVKAKASGVEGSVTGAVTTEAAPTPVVCTPPAVFTSGINACVYPMGIKVYLDKATAPAGAVTNATFPGQAQSGLLPPACRLHTDACWKEAVRNGTVSFVFTSALNLSTPTRPTVFASYKTVDTMFFPGQNKMLFCKKPFYADDGSYASDNQFVENRCSPEDELSYHVGNSLGEIFLSKKIATGVNTCYQKKFMQNVGQWEEYETPCP